MSRRLVAMVVAAATGVAALSLAWAEPVSAETVTSLPGGGWFDDPRGEPDTATSRLVTGPGTPLEGSGSLELGVGKANEAALVTNLLVNDVIPPTLFTPFDGLSGSWSTYVPTGNELFSATSVRFEGYTRGSLLLGDYMTVIFDPVFQGTVTPGQWQTWDIDDSAVVYQTRNGESCDEVAPCTFSEFLDEFPRVAFYDVQLGVGSFVTLSQPIVSFVDAVHLSFEGGSIDTDFEAPPTPPVQTPPVAAADTYATRAGQALVVGAASGLLLNDTAQDGHAMTTALATPPTSGQVQLATDGSFTYTPASGFTGTDTFTYTATDAVSNLVSAPATVTVEVTPEPPPIPPDPPDPPAVNGSQFVPLSPVRIVDTRTGLGASGPLTAGSTTIVATAAGGVPAGATAVAVNITATDPTSLGYIQAFPTGSAAQGSSSNLNIDHRGQTVADLTLVGLDAAGTFSVYSQPSTQLVIDVFGYFVPVNTATSGRLVALAPVRVLDTRSGVGAPTAPVAAGGSIVLNLASTVPADATAVVMTLTATNTPNRGYVQAIPTGGATAIGASSNLNVDRAGDTTANSVIVPLGSNTSVTLFSQSGADLVADVVGYFTGASATESISGLFIPVVPRRLADTRVTGVVPAGGTTISVPVAGRPNVPTTPPTAIAGTITATETSDPGFVQVFPTGSTTTAGSTSSMNFNGPGRTLGVATIVGTSTGAISLYAHVATHLIYDITGYFV